MADTQYNSPEEMANSLAGPSNDNKQAAPTQYNSPEEMANQLINGPPSTTQKITHAVGQTAHDLSGSTYDTFFGNNGILTNAGAAASQSWGAKPFERTLDKYTSLKDTDSTISGYAKAFNSVVLRPVAAAADFVGNVGASGILGGMSLVSSTAEHTGEGLNTFAKQNPYNPLSPVVGEVGDIIGAGLAGQRGGQELNGQYFPEGSIADAEHYATLGQKTAEARAKTALGEGEESYFNTIKPHPEDLQDRQAVAQKAGVEPAPEYPTTNTNLDWVARQTNPDAFKEWDAKLDYHDELENRLNQWEDQGTIPGATEEPPELSALKEQYQDNYKRLKELEPEINDAYTHAQTLMPPEDELKATLAEQEKARTASQEAQEAQEEKGVSSTGQPLETPVAPSEGLWRAPKGSISDDVAQKLVATGTDPEVAQAAGQITEAQYNARATRFGGRLGNAQDLYKERFPTVVAGRGPKGKGVKARTLNQVNEASDRLRVARRMPDGSVKIGEPGQLHMDLIGDDELDRKAAGFVHMDENDMGFATPEGKYLNRQEALDWVKGHQPELNEDLMHGGPRNQDALESTGYEKEISKADRYRAATEGEVTEPQEEVPNNLGITEGKTRFEHEAEMADIGRQAAKDFNDKHFGPDRFKSIEELDRTYNQDDTKPTFYSALSRGVDNLDLKSGTPEQWSKTIDNLKGIKKEEIDWSGLKEWLKDKKGSVSKDDVQKFLKENEVNIQEVEKSSTTKAHWMQSDVENRAKEFAQRDFPTTSWENLSTSSKLDYLDQAEKSFKTSPTKFDQYTLPGGENYRELLLTLPDENKFTKDWTREEQKELDQLHSKMFDERTFEERIRTTALETKHRINYENISKKEFRGIHWDEPNVLSNILMDDRTGPNGEKILHLAEVQSDWHQKGRKLGYEQELSEEDKSKIKSLEDIKTRAETELEELHEDVKRGEGVSNSQFNDLHKHILDVTEQIDKITNKTLGVPNAPFKKTWQELSMKRMLRYAAENGYDKLSWDTGETVADRYDLSKQINSIHYELERNHLQAYDKNDNVSLNQTVAPEGLPDLIGKDAADKLLNKPTRKEKYKGENGEDRTDHVLEGLDLKVGGEGMKGFYDKILPDFMNKYVKKWDSKVEDSNLKIGDHRHSGEEIDHLVERVLNPSINKKDFPDNSRIEKIHSVDVTPKMKESVMEGQPLFQNKRGSISFAPNGRAVLRLFKSQNASTPFHELGHLWLEELSKDALHPEAPDELKQDWKTVKDFLGIKEEQSQISRPQHELFARTFERYLREGNAPSEELKSVFAKIKDWLLKVYQHISELNAPISNPVREVFDRLLTEKETEEKATEETPQTETSKAETQPETDNTLEQRDRPSHRRLPAIKATGEETNYGLANRINDVLQNDFDSELNDMDTRKKAQFKLGQARVAEHVAANPQEGYEIAMGNKPVTTPDATPEMYFNAMTQYALAKKDIQMLNDLSESRLVRELTTMAQRLASVKEGYSTSSPNAALLIRSIEEARREFYQKNTKIPGSQGVKTRTLTPEESSKLIDKTDDVQQAYLKYQNTNKLQDRIDWGKKFLDLKDYVDDLKPKYKSQLDRAQEYTGEAVGAFKTMQTGIGHLSAIMVQGLGSMSHPEFYKGAVEMMKYFANPEAYRELQAKIITDPWYAHMRGANLGLTDISTKLNNIEEEIGTHLLLRLNQYAAEKMGLPINIMGASSRAFTGYLNYLRSEVFSKSMGAAKLAGEDVDVRGQASKDIAAAINDFTGRSNLGKDDRYRNFSRVLNMFAYAPRKVAANFQVFNPWEYVKPGQSPTARNLRFRNLAGLSLGVGSMLLLAKGLGADVDFDPRANDFGEIKIGNTKIDVFPGFRTAMRFLSQVGTGTMIANSGKTDDLDSGDYNSPNRATTALQYFRGKESPLAAIITDRMMNADPVGNEFNLTREVKQKMTPIFMNNFMNFLDNDSENTMAWAPAALGLFGVGVSEPIPEANRQGLNSWGEPYGDTETKVQSDLDRAFKSVGVNPSFPARTIKGVRLNNEQYHNYIQMSGQALSDAAGFYVNSPSWQLDSIEDKKKALKGFVRDARRQAANALAIQPANQDALDQWNNNPLPGLEPDLSSIYQTNQESTPH